MDPTQIIGFSAAFFLTAANIPQTYIIIRDKSAEHISVSTYLLLLIGTLLWVYYGITKQDWPIIITNSITVMTTSLILFLNFSSKKVIGKIHDKVLPESIKEKARKRNKK